MLTSSCIAMLALRRCVSMSAMGSVMDMWPPSPTRLGHARDLAGVSQLAEADAAQHELAEHGARAAAALAAGVGPYLELRLALLLLDERLFRHYCPSLRKGKSNASRRALPSASVRAVVTI